MGVLKKALITATMQSHVAQFHKPLMRLLKENGYEVHVAAKDNLAEKNGLQLVYADRVFDVPFSRSPFGRTNLRAYRQIKEIISGMQYEVISCNTPVGGVVTRLAAKKARKSGTKVFYTAHGFHFYKGAPVQNWLLYYPVEKWLARYTDTLITITDEDYALARKKLGANVVRLHGMGANTEKYYPVTQAQATHLRQEMGYKGNTPLLLCIGELLKNKNQQAIIRAMQPITARFPEAKLLLAGNGPCRPQLMQLARDLKLQDAVEFLGYRTDLQKYIHIADIIVTCSFREGLPLNVMEAMLCAKPVIASNNRGHRELVKDGLTGYIVEPEDIEGYVGKVIALMENQALYTQLCENARAGAEPYKDQSVLNELKAIYKE